MDLFLLLWRWRLCADFSKGGSSNRFQKDSLSVAINLILIEEGLQNVLGGNVVLMIFNLSVLYVF